MTGENRHFVFNSTADSSSNFKERRSRVTPVCLRFVKWLIKIGAKVVRHAKYVTFQMAEVAVPRDLFAAILERIQRFGVPPPLL